MHKVVPFMGIALISAAAAQVGKHCPNGLCPSSLSVTLPPPIPPCGCPTPCGPTCSVFTAATVTLDPSFVTLTSQVPKTITTFSSCPIFSETTTFETTVQSFTETTVLTLSNSTTTFLSTVTNVVSTTTTRTTKCSSTRTSTECTDCGCGSNFTTTLNPPTSSCHHRHHDHHRCHGGCFSRCYYGCPQVSHDDRLMYVLPRYTSCYNTSVICPTLVPINPTGVPPVIPVCPSCPPLPTVTITPENYVITVIAYGPSPTSLNIACLTAN